VENVPGTNFSLKSSDRTNFTPEQIFCSTTRKFVKQCEICQRQNKKAKTAVPELNYASIGQRVWGKIGIDLIRPFLTEKKEPLSILQ
jgi:hypothetical protein